MAVYVTSDLHGYPIDRFKSFLESTGFGSDDQLYIIGDVVDRGLDGVKYLLWISEQPNVHLVLGNHEWMMLNCEFIVDVLCDKASESLNPTSFNMLQNWMNNGCETTVQELTILATTDPEKLGQIYDLIRSAPVCMPLTVGERKFFLVHGGLSNFNPEDETFDYDEFGLVWHRPTLDERYFNSVTTIIGHTPTLFFGSEYAGKMVVTDTWIDIDTGAAAGGHPMLLRLDDMKEFYVS